MLLNIFSPCHRIPVTARRTEPRLASNREQVYNRTVGNLTKPFEISLQARNLSIESLIYSR
jgi:hypothetical protein